MEHVINEAKTNRDGKMWAMDLKKRRVVIAHRREVICEKYQKIIATHASGEVSISAGGGGAMARGFVIRLLTGDAAR